MRLFVLVLSFWLSVSSLVTAATDDFIVALNVNSDNIPPSTPVIASTTPISTSQIDVVWSASTDNAAVAGYQVFRDTVFIATTTLTTYSDTGLLASTTYSYTVRAFDTNSNFSSTSAALATTTLPEPPPPPEPVIPPIVESTKVTVSMLDLDIKTTRHSATFAWSTKGHAQYLFRWGRTTSYELGYVSTDVFSRAHKTEVTDLEPGTTYEYELIAYDRRGQEYVLSRSSFTTDEAPDISAPSNVSNLQAEVIGDDVRLGWVNPYESDFSHVRVLRNHIFYPDDPFDGFMVYQGSGSGVYDSNAFALGPNQYYTVFSYDYEGNISSGAIVWVNQKGIISIIDLQATTTGSWELDFSDLLLVQEGEIIQPNQAGRYVISGDKNLTAKLLYEKVPEHLKAITVTFVHPDDQNKIFTFMLRINRDKTYYEATIAPLETSGLYTTILDVFDFKTNLLLRVKGEILSISTESTDSAVGIVPLVKNKIIIVTVSLLLLLLVVFMAWRLVERRQEENYQS